MSDLRYKVGQTVYATAENAYIQDGNIKTGGRGTIVRVDMHNGPFARYPYLVKYDQYPGKEALWTAENEIRAGDEL